MAILVECRICKRRNSIKHVVCKCGKNLSKTSGKVYWIEYYLHGKRKRERIGKSKPAAENRLRLVQTAKVEGRHIKKNLNAEISLNQLRDWYLNLDEVKQLSSFDRIEVLTRHIMRIYGKNISIDEITPEGVRLYREKEEKNFVFLILKSILLKQLSIGRFQHSKQCSIKGSDTTFWILTQ